LLFRRFWTRAAGAVAGLWLTPFSVEDPINTPRDLNTLHPQVMLAFGDALNDLAGASIPVDAPLGEFQKDVRPDGTTTSYHGGPGGLGVFNAMAAPWNAEKGYVGRLPHGSSFIQAVSFDGDGCPDTRTMLTYSQSTNPKSPHYADQTRLFRDGGWVTGAFCEADVKRATLSTQRLRAVGGAATAGPVGVAGPGLPATGLPTALGALAVASLLGAAVLRRRSR
jgi:acyl-homoserine-lactone acylase